MHLRQFVFTGILLTVLTVTSASNQEFNYYDTVEVEAGDGLEPQSSEPVYLNRLRRETLTGADGTKIRINCKTARNEEGHCKQFKECYPMFLLRDLEDRADRSIPVEKGHFELEAIYRNVSGPCDKQVLDAINSISISKEAQQEYVCCPIAKKPNKPSRPPAPVPSPTPGPDPEINSDRCGKILVDYKAELESLHENTTTDAELRGDSPQKEVKIVNGRQTARGEFPWVVAIMNNGRQFCGGSLISNSHILTAAHCVYFMNRQDVNRMRIFIGDYNVYSNNDGPHEVRSASNIYYHKTFSMNTLHDDVAVIRLTKPVQFGRYIQPVCLHSGSPKYDTGNTIADVTGWGQIANKGPPSPVLKTVEVRVLPQNDCIKAYKGKAPGGITPGMVCAGGNGRDSCKGDSGGPLTINSRTQARQIGVVSWGIGCATYPGVYTRVDKYWSWIHKNLR